MERKLYMEFFTKYLISKPQYSFNGYLFGGLLKIPRLFLILTLPYLKDGKWHANAYLESLRGQIIYFSHICEESVRDKKLAAKKIFTRGKAELKNEDVLLEDFQITLGRDSWVYLDIILPDFVKLNDSIDIRVSSRTEYILVNDDLKDMGKLVSLKILNYNFQDSMNFQKFTSHALLK